MSNYSIPIHANSSASASFNNLKQELTSNMGSGQGGTMSGRMAHAIKPCSSKDQSVVIESVMDRQE